MVSQWAGWGGWSGGGWGASSYSAPSVGGTCSSQQSANLGSLASFGAPGSLVTGDPLPPSTNEPVLIGDQVDNPEPATMLMLGAGLAGLGWYRRRQRA